MSALDDYPYRRVLGTRWADNDIYGHVNNVQYYALFDRAPITSSGNASDAW
jgi:acyl-CoA thioester hydrolase